MNAWLVAAAAVLALIGVVHSWLGERRIFRHLRRGGAVPTGGAPVLREFQTRILWGCWHLASLLGFALVGLLLWLATPAAREVSGGIAETIIAATMIACAGLVAWSNRGRHPAWAACLLVAGLMLRSYL